MFRTITANPFLVTQGSHLCISQEKLDAKNKLVERRYVLMNSDTLQSQTFSSKEAFEAAISQLIEAHEKAQKKTSVLDQLTTDGPVGNTES
jgi:hypothetical protein